MAEIADTPRAHVAIEAGESRRWTILAVVLVGTFMAIMDAAIVNVAIPAIRAELHASFGEVEFVVAAYTLVYAVFLITGGRLGDLYGRKVLFMKNTGATELTEKARGSSHVRSTRGPPRSRTVARRYLRPQARAS